MLRLILDGLLLWKTFPVVLSYFGLKKLTREIDQHGNTWTGPKGTAPGVAVVHPKVEDILLSFAGCGYALQNIFFGGRR